jgi:hypothetical protein
MDWPIPRPAGNPLRAYPAGVHGRLDAQTDGAGSTSFALDGIAVALVPCITVLAYLGHLGLNTDSTNKNEAAN